VSFFSPMQRVPKPYFFQYQIDCIPEYDTDVSQDFPSFLEIEIYVCVTFDIG